MVMRRRHPGLSAPQQALGLQRRFPQGSLELGPGQLTFTCELQPTQISRSYRIRVRYRAGGQPRVWVLSELPTRPGQPLPHTYKEGTLCLYRRGDWNSQMQLADSIVPWAAEWLAFYEIWLVTGEWEGGGEWPPTRASDFAAKIAADEDGISPPPALEHR